VGGFQRAITTGHIDRGGFGRGGLESIQDNEVRGGGNGFAGISGKSQKTANPFATGQNNLGGGDGNVMMECYRDEGHESPNPFVGAIMDSISTGLAGTGFSTTNPF